MPKIQRKVGRYPAPRQPFWSLNFSKMAAGRQGICKEAICPLALKPPARPGGEGDAKDMPRPPPPWFPPLDSPFRGAPSQLRNPQRGKPIPLPAAIEWKAGSATSWGGGRAGHGPRPALRGMSFALIPLTTDPSAPPGGSPKYRVVASLRFGGGSIEK
jgi:hypothetical protein